MDKKHITDKIIEQIIIIRDSGVCNMLDAAGVQRAAYDRGLHELVLFIHDHKKEYSSFILTGQR
ncbi:MAG: DUF5049 domain-containing protein [Eubacteriales bacterium]|nr:DUF5049 domain-containing protein [Eubacteriales bacterium]